jgi:hypothetical protein
LTVKQLQSLLLGGTAFSDLQSYGDFTQSFLELAKDRIRTRIVSPTTPNYIFYQYDSAHANRITRPVNIDLFVEEPAQFQSRLKNFHDILEILRAAQTDKAAAVARRKLDVGELDRIVYTTQQAVGCIGDSLPNANQSRKRIGMIFEKLIQLIIREVGVSCEPRTVNIPLPGHPGRKMSYQLDLVFSRGQAIVAKEQRVIADNEIIGSVKTTSKDRFDKVFLDKFLLSRLLGRDVKVIAIFLHDVQRAVRKQGKSSGQDLFGVNTTFKSNHFLGYTLALNPLDGVYYVDPRPIMAKDPDLAREISTLSRFISQDLWLL